MWRAGVLARDDGFGAKFFGVVAVYFYQYSVQDFRP